MKTIFLKKNIILLGLLFFIGSSAFAQNYHSTPTAITNLVDEAKYLSNALPTLQDTNPDQYKVNKETLRFIKKMISALKKGEDIDNAVNKVLPKSEWNILQPAVRFINTADSGKPPHQFIRDEVMKLITY